MNIYIKAKKKVISNGQTSFKLRDIAEVYAPEKIADEVKNIEVLRIKGGVKKDCLISIIDVINAVDKKVPGYEINTIGETDTVIDYIPPKRRNENKFFKWLKIAFVSLLLLSGSATAIMSFHSDSQIPTVFKNYYKIFFNEEIENPTIIDISYSIGLALGIVVFFNHFAGKKITMDPTPIEVEMSLYETDVTDTMIDTLNVEKDEKTKGKNEK